MTVMENFSAENTPSFFSSLVRNECRIFFRAFVFVYVCIDEVIILFEHTTKAINSFF